MKSIILHCLFAVFMSQVTFGQLVETRKKLTVEETKAVQEISFIFNKRINETGDISSIFDELFVNDFIERFIKEKKREISQYIKTYRPEFFNPDRVPFVLSLYFKSDLLDKATSEDWKRLYISTFNFKHFEIISSLNHFAKLENSGEKYELDDLIKFENHYPPKIIELFDNHPNLKGFIRKKFNSDSIKTIEELRSVNETLEHGLKLLNEGKNGKPAVEFSEVSKKLRAKLKVRQYFGAKVEINNDDFFGFPKGTRFITVWLPPGRKLFIVKIADRYKIILKPFP